MQALEVANKLRLILNDTDKLKYSDYEIINHINDALLELANESSKANAELFRDRATLAMSQGKAVLPEGYIKEIKAFDPDGAELFNVQNDEPMTGEFSVKGKLAYSAEKSIVLWYFKYPAAITSLTSEIDLPDVMTVPVAKVAAFSIQGDNGQMIAMAQFCLGITQTQVSGKKTSSSN